MTQVIQIGNIVDDTSIGFKNPQRGRVYSAEGIAPCLNTCGGGGLEPKIAALRGRNPDNPSERGQSSGNYKQRLEMNENGTSNTLTSVQKDNLVVEPLCSVRPNSHKFEFNPETSIKPISPALRATDYKAPHCVREPQVMTPKRTEFGKVIRKQYEAHDVKMSRHDMTTMEPREDGISNTLTSVWKDNLLCEPRYRIRKLTPRECFRLMGVEDKDIDTIQAAGISNSQQYKMAGNSIVVDVLYHLFVKAFIDHTSTEPFYQQTLF